ncbi:hypothetical protein B484DRAFT_432144 [Ochromonadaceae sp. CCMP2298]|nr:hypothetical protein B484DRAFT_432144 [Ochromonadaceae sp. CCMP2298]
MTSLTLQDVRAIVGEMEALVQRDEGGRGIADLLLPPGELFNAALEASQAKSVIIITGFPCMIDHTPPTETDGPLGALAIARSLLQLGTHVTLVTDECNEEVLLACAAAAASWTEGDNTGDITGDTTTATTATTGTARGVMRLESFPPHMGQQEHSRLTSLRDSHNLVIAIERAGPAADGRYLTMRARDMTHLVAPLEMLLLPDMPPMPDMDDMDPDMELLLDDEDADMGASASGAVNNGVECRPPRSIGIGGI